MALSIESVYQGYDNTISLRLQVDGVTIADHTTITRAIIEFGRGDSLLAPDPYYTLDSDIDASAFDFTDSQKLILLLGDIELNKGPHNVSLAIYLPGYTGGLSFGQALGITIK